MSDSSFHMADRGASLASSNLEAYQKMLELSGAMLRSASQSDWNGLAELEQQCRTLLDGLKTSDELVPLAKPQVEHKVALIKGILANDAAIRTHVEPWMAGMAKYLGDAGRQRQVNRAYGA